MKVLITGGAGFVGSHLAERLLAAGGAVHVIDDLSTGAFSNIAHLKERDGFGYTIGSIMDVPLTAELVDQCDVVIHLAAAVGVQLIVESPVRTIETNVRGTEIVLELANKKKRKVMVASTSEVYGKSDKIPFVETADITIGPTHLGRWAYACSKALDEFLALAYHNEKRLDVVVFRLFNTVGARQTGRYGMVLPRFVRQALRGAPLSVYGDGTQRRAFASVRDVIGGIEGLMRCDEAVGEVVNLGHDEEVTILGLAERVIERTGSKSEIEFIPYEDAYAAGFEDMMRRVPDLKKAKRLVGYEPSVNLDEIIDEVIGFQRLA